jgi:hypothetical protein
MDAVKVARSDVIDQYLAWSRERLSEAFAWAMNLMGQPQDVSWDTATQFVSDYVLLPLVVVVVLLIVVKHALSD